MQTNQFKGPMVVSQMVFWNSEFLGVIRPDGHILKFNCQDGSRQIWLIVGSIITVLEWAVYLNKVEPQTFDKLRQHLLQLYKMNQNGHQGKDTSRYLNKVSSLVEAYWDRLEDLNYGTNKV